MPTTVDPTRTAPTTPGDADLAAHCRALAEDALVASRALARASGGDRNAALHAVADAIDENSEQLRHANAADLEQGRAAGLSPAMLDRLELTRQRITSMAGGVREVAAQTDPVGKVDEGRVLPSGIRLEKRRVPIGVVLMIFESRPNVTADAAALCLKSGNAVILRGGKEAAHSNAAIAQCVTRGLTDAGLPPKAVQLVPTADRAAVGHLLQLEGLIDVCIPRGGESLIRAVVEQSRIPVIKHYTGNCHVYIDASADADMAEAICVNAKTQRTGVCNAAETLLFHKEAADRGLLTRVCHALRERGVEVRGDTRTAAACPDVEMAQESDWSTEFLDKIIAVRVVDSVEAAISHINRYGSKHTDAILTADLAAADAFVTGVDTANAFVNCSTRFSDGMQYGLGAEIGISTDKLHARGPMGANDLTTYKWIAYGNGQVRD